MARTKKIDGKWVEMPDLPVPSHTNKDAAKAALGKDPNLKVKVWYNPDVGMVLWELYERKSNRFVAKGDCDQKEWKNSCMQAMTTQVTESQNSHM